VLGVDQSGVVGRGARCPDRPYLSDHALSDHHPWRILEGAGLSGTLPVIHPAGRRLAGAAGVVRHPVEETAALAMSGGNIFHLGIKELRSLARDPIMLFLIVWAFSVAIYTAATAMPDTLNRAPIAIVDEDRSPLSGRIVAAFYPPHFLPPALITRDEMDARMDAGLDSFALDIPPEFQSDLLAGKRPAIQLNVDATRMSQAFTGSGYIQTIINDEVNAFLARYRAASV